MSIRELYDYNESKPNCNPIFNKLLNSSPLIPVTASVVLTPEQFVSGVIQVPSGLGVIPAIHIALPAKISVDTYLTQLFGAVPVGYVFTCTIVNHHTTALAVDPALNYNFDIASNNIQPNSVRTLTFSIGQNSYTYYG